MWLCECLNESKFVKSNVIIIVIIIIILLIIILFSII